MATIEIQSGLEAGKRFELAADQALLGRDPLCDIVLPAHGISRQHARLVRDGLRYAIEDLGSVNGTFVNHLRIQDRQTLCDQDSIHLYDIKLVYHDPNEPRPVRAGDDAIAAAATLTSPPLAIMHAVDATADLQSVLGSKAQMRAVLRITRELGGSLDCDQMLPRLLDSLFAVFSQAQAGHVLLADPLTGDLSPKAIKQGRAGGEGGSDTYRPINQAIVHRVMHDGEAVLSVHEPADARESVLESAPLSMICAPLIGPSHKPLGVLYLETEDPRKSFTPDDLELLASAGVAAGQMVEHAYEHAASLKLARRERDLDAARQMQLNLLPQQRPEMPGYRFFDYYHAADGVGGDFLVTSRSTTAA